ncbi:MAG: MFS transporter [Sphaerochaetaceae bacterium]
MESRAKDCAIQAEACGVQEHVSFKSKISVSAADGVCGILNGLVTAGGLSYFFTKYLGLSEALTSIVWVLFGIWNAFNDPLFGYISDHTKSRLGRRVPYIRYGSIFYAAVFIFSWIKWPASSSQGGMFFQMLSSLFLFDTLYTAIATSLYVMPFELAVSNKARSSILIYKMIFSLISLGAPLVLFPLIKPEPGESPVRFQMIMTAIGVTSFLIIFFSTFFYKENGYTQAEEQPPLFSSIGKCFRNKSFIIFESISFTVIFVQTILMQGVIYYFDEFRVSMAVCYGAMVAGAVAGIVLWIAKRDGWGVKRCMIIMCGLFGLGALIMVFLGGIQPVAALCFFLVGIGFAGGMYLVPIMNGDVIDYDESVTGLRREGMYAGVNSLITKPAISLANAAFLMLIKAFGYDQTLAGGLQGETARNGILVAWMAIPAALLIACFFILRAYPLDGSAWEETKLRLAHQHAQKQAEYEKRVL